MKAAGPEKRPGQCLPATAQPRRMDYNADTLITMADRFSTRNTRRTRLSAKNIQGERPIVSAEIASALLSLANPVQPDTVYTPVRKVPSFTRNGYTIARHERQFRSYKACPPTNNPFCFLSLLRFMIVQDVNHTLTVGGCPSWNFILRYPDIASLPCM